MNDPVANMHALHTLADGLPAHLPSNADLLIHNDDIYRVTVERLPPDKAREALEAFKKEADRQWTS